MKRILETKVVSNRQILSNIFDLTVNAPDIAKSSKAGQFVEVYANDKSLLLPRPISICEIIGDNLRMVYQVVGKGTEYFSNLKENDVIRVLGSCGNGYTISDDNTENVFVGGGIGVPPLLETVKQTKGNKTVVLGFRSETFLVAEFEKYGAKVHIATDDGSSGFHGNAVQLLRELNLKSDMIYSCGPKVMLKALSDYALENNLNCQVSMEERMACGIGACVGCVVKIKENDGWTYKKVCKDGPVFNFREVDWE